MAQNLGYRHGEPMLHRHGRAKTKSRRRSKQQSGTVVPRQNSAALFWLLGFDVRGVFSAAARVFPRGENPTFQALYKEGQA